MTASSSECHSACSGLSIFISQSTPFSLPTWTGEYQDESGHSRWFMSMLFNLFRQTDYEHQLCGDSPGLLL